MMTPGLLQSHLRMMMMMMKVLLQKTTHQAKRGEDAVHRERVDEQCEACVVLLMQQRMWTWKYWIGENHYRTRDWWSLEKRMSGQGNETLSYYYYYFPMGIAVHCVRFCSRLHCYGSYYDCCCCCCCCHHHYPRYPRELPPPMRIQHRCDV